jgi:hypothetical protein
MCIAPKYIVTILLALLGSENEFRNVGSYSHHIKL